MKVMNSHQMLSFFVFFFFFPVWEELQLYNLSSLSEISKVVVRQSQFSEGFRTMQ